MRMGEFAFAKTTICSEVKAKGFSRKVDFMTYNIVWILKDFFVTNIFHGSKTARNELRLSMPKSALIDFPNC